MKQSSTRKRAAYAPMMAERKFRIVSREEQNDSEKMIYDEELVGKLEEKLVTDSLQSTGQMVEDTQILAEVESFQRVKINSSSSSISLIDETFSIMSLVNSLLQYMNEPENVIEPDDTIPLYKDASILKGEWAREFYSICNKFILSKIAQEEILNLIYNTWGNSSNLPVALTTDGKKRLECQLRKADQKEDDSGSDDDSDNSISAPNALSKVDRYTRKASRWIKINQCANSCCVFLGKLQKAFACPDCGARRFKTCVRSGCEGKGKDDNCDHLFMDGVAIKNLHYRLLIPLLTDLINTKYFVAALHYINDKQFSEPYEEEAFTDILDGDVAKEHLQGMDNNYKAWCSENSTARSGTVPVNLLLMDFYDGGQLFRYRTCDFWGFFITIVNLPPAYRGKLGISTFLSAIYGGKHKTAERFLFTDLYCEELRALYEGVEYVGNSGQRFFIQARLIFHVMDTKALEPVLNMQSMTNSRYGCPYCRNAHGQHNSWKVVYLGNRNTLPLFHYLRFFGQSGLCCPQGFYLPGANWFVPEDFISDEKPIMAVSLRRKNNMGFCKPCDEDPTRYEQIKAFLLDDNAQYIWHHKKGSGFDFSDISMDEKGIRDRCFYRHFDFRPQVTYRRITKKDHLQSAHQAKELNKNRTTQEKHKVDGFYDVWPFERLPYSDLSRNSSPPPCHAMQGMIKRCLDYMLGNFKERKPARRIYPKKKQVKNAKSKKGDVYDKKEEEDYTEVDDGAPKYRPSYHDTPPPYAASTHQVKMCHAWLLCVLIPTGMPDSKDWVLDLNQTGLFKMDMWKKLVLVFWDFILSILTTIDEWYRLLFRMFADKLLKLLSFRIEKNSVSQLQDEVNEMICLWESFFPDSQNFFQLHQIMDLVSSLPLFGSMHAWSELFGEQALAKLKRIKGRTNPGGVSYATYIMQRQVDSELDTMGRFYSHTVNKKDKQAANYKTKVSFNAEKKILSYNVMQFDIYGREREDTNSYYIRDLNRRKIGDKDPNLEFTSNLNTYELNELVLLLLREIRKRYKGSEYECKRNSCLYRCFSIKEIDFPSNSNAEWLETVVLNDDLYDNDVVLVAKSLLSLKLSFHSKAWIYGLQFRSRGSACREYFKDFIPKVPPQRYGSGIYNARDARRWNYKVDYSSWCMFQQSSSSTTQTALRYGKLNAFFEVRIGDNSIDGLLVASITSHKVRSQTSVNVDIVDCIGSLDPSIIFVALQDIYPTRVGIIPIAENGKANKINDNAEAEDREFVNLRSDNMEMAYSYMLKLDPDKISRYPKWRPYTLYLTSGFSDGSSFIDDYPLEKTYQHDESNHNHSHASRSKSCSTWEIRKNNRKMQSSTVASVDPESHSFNKTSKTWNQLRSVAQFHSAEPQNGRASSSSLSGSNMPHHESSAVPLVGIISLADGSIDLKSSSSNKTSKTWKPNSSSKVQLRSVAQFHSAEPQDGRASSSSLSGSNMPHHESSAEPLVGIISLAEGSIDLKSSSSNKTSKTWKPNSSPILVRPGHESSAVPLVGISPEKDNILLSWRNVELTEEDVTHLSGVLSGTIIHPATTVLIDKFGIDMTVAKISCLKPRTWLNDEVINFYVSMLMQDLKTSTKAREFYSFSSFFMTKVYERGQYEFNNVARWTKNIDIFGLKKVFIPINIDNEHWVLVLIDLIVKTIVYYDSMAGDGSLYMDVTLQVFPTWHTLSYLYELSITF